MPPDLLLLGELDMTTNYNDGYELHDCLKCETTGYIYTDISGSVEVCPNCTNGYIKKLTAKGEELLRYLMNESVAYERILNTELDRITIESETEATIHLVGWDIVVKGVLYNKYCGYVYTAQHETVPNVLQ